MAKSKSTSPEKKFRDGGLLSPWNKFENSGPEISKYDPAKVYDCLIVGAGITGLTTALLLQREGKKTVIAEAYTPGFGTTGGTSAHINTFADTTFTEAADAFGDQGSQLFSDAITEGFQLIKDNISDYKISCDFEEKTGYIYAEDAKQSEELDKLYSGALQVGQNVSYTDKVPAPLPFQSAIAFPGQAQFHPLKYLQGIAEAYIKSGGIILSNTRIDSIESENGIHSAVSDKDGQIRSKAVVYATHIPPGITSFNFRSAAYRSYVLGVKLTKDAYPDALVYDMQDPYHYFRTHIIGSEKLLIAGGNDHKTGHDDPEKAFADLEKYIRKHYPVSSVKYKWSSQYYTPSDGFPYIGQMPEAADGIYCATGFNGNGMMLGSVSARILSDLITGVKSKYKNVFSPARIKPIAGFKEFIAENADVVQHFIADRLTIHKTDSLNRMKPDTGRVVEVNGIKIAAYKDPDGYLHTLNPVCTHAKCIVNWNQEEKSWDCPCHGARYDIDGEVLTGPARRNLGKV